MDVKITAIDNENKKVSLSIRALEEPSAPAEEESEAETEAEYLNYPPLRRRRAEMQLLRRRFPGQERG